ncbi:MAG: hypothetical protein NT056_04415 [Proteobacteria bacterium]|nr:hypothetical protein [Pseudomonadota bacterium]
MKIPLFLNSWREKIRGLKMPEFIARMTPKERLTLVLGVVGAFLIIFVGFFIFPISREKKELREKIQLKTQELKEMTILSQDYGGARAEGGARGVIPADFSILSYLEELADQSQIREKIEYMRPGNVESKGKHKEVSVEIKLNAVSLSELTNLLFRIEKGGQTPLIVYRMMVRSRFANPRELDVTLTVIGISPG